MDSLFLQRTENLVSSDATSGGGSSNGGHLLGLREENENRHVPAWKLPLTSSLLGNSNNGGGSRTGYGNDVVKNPVIREIPIKLSHNPKKVTISPELAEDEATAQLIQILLPCIICNRTFSPEALERHSKICTVVNEKSPHKSNRGKFDSAEQRKKDTKLADFIPPPEIDANGEFVRTGSQRYRSSFSRGSRNTSSFGKGGTTTTVTVTNPTSLIPTWRKGVTSPTKTTHSGLDHHHPKSNSHVEPFEDTSEFGSEESQQDLVSNADTVNLPHYARALSPSEDCPYCGRNFGMKAFDRHVNFCKELYMRKQYETQPIPDEKKEAMERQELRTKYRKMKGSNSCGSLRSMSPPKDFPSMMARKFYGFMNATFNRNNFKKSNESLTNSCYGDYTRGMRRTSPAPSSIIGGIPKPGVYQRSNSTITPSSVSSMKGGIVGGGGSSVLRMHNSVPKRTKSIENLASLNGVQCSGYGQPQYSNNSHGGGGGGGGSFTRNSKTRSSLHKNFFRNSAKRAEPEGVETTQSSGSPGSLIITPMSFYSKGKNYNGNSSASFLQQQQQHHQKQLQLGNNNPNSLIMMNRTNSINSAYGGEHHGGVKKSLLTSDPHYDPYEKAARQFEELLKAQPPSTVSRISSNKNRKVGLDHAFRSVVIPEPDYNGHSPHDKSDQENRSYSSSTPNNNKSSLVNHDNLNYSSSHNDSSKVNSGNSFHPPSDERLLSYWEQILQSDDLKSQSQNTQEDSQAISSDSDNSKSRAVSNISSIDSAFSRSDGADLEFEALETLMSSGDQTSSPSHNHGGGGGSGPKPSMLPTVIGSTRNTSLASLPSAHANPSSDNLVSSSTTTTIPVIHSQSQRQHSDMTLPLLSSNSNQQQTQPHHQNLSRFSSQTENNYENGGGRSVSPEPKLSTKQNNNSNSNGAGALARFCYECGTCYPTPTAKFCPECGERRVIK